jgi:hypothetical protein
MQEHLQANVQANKKIQLENLMQEHLQANGNKKQESFTGLGPTAINLGANLRTWSDQ